MDPLGGVPGGEKRGQPLLDPEQALGQELRGVVGPLDGQPEYPGQEQEHQRYPRPAGGEQAVQSAVPLPAVRAGVGDHMGADILRGQNQRGNNAVFQGLSLQPRRRQGRAGL